MTPFETTIYQWEEGRRRLRDVDPADRRAIERVTQEIVRELRRRLGGTFTTQELADYYSRGTDWCLDVAIATAPQHPRAWDAQIVADAAFALYVREASDFAGGRRL